MPRTRQALPAWIPPMLASPGVAFDSDQHLFEVKWDGTRCLCFIDGPGKYRLLNRRKIDMTDRYPEFAFLGDLTPGTVLDGEIVVLRDGKPDFGLLMTREQARSPLKVRSLSRMTPAHFLVFDLLYDAGKSVMSEPLRARRQLLEDRVEAWDQQPLVLSRGVVGAGKALARETIALGLEGIVAKRLDSKYLAGKRTTAWVKIKRGEELLCVVIGYQAEGKDDFRSLIIATDDGGQLRCVGKVGSGIDHRIRERLNAYFVAHARAKPIIPCKVKGKWVEPGLICRVSCMERSAGGELRAPVFEELLQG